MSVVVGNEVTAVRVHLHDLVRINETPFDFTKDDVADFVVRLLAKSQQGTAFEDGQHGLAEALHFAHAFGLQHLPESVVFVHNNRIFGRVGNRGRS